MTEPTMSTDTDPNSVRKVVSVQAPQAVAWRVFTEKMGTWWPLAYYKIGKANAVVHQVSQHPKFVVALWKRADGLIVSVHARHRPRMDSLECVRNEDELSRW